MLLTVIDFIARLHPLLVHLPIGILLLAIGFRLAIDFKLQKTARTNADGQPITVVISPFESAVNLMFFWGAIGAIFSCISGWLLAGSGDYEGELVNQHRWLGIATAVVATLFYWWGRRSKAIGMQRWVAIGLLLLVSITGHLGGSLTHGPEYLQEALQMKAATKGPVITQLSNPDTAILYESIVQPILEARCYSCHGTGKQKGKLRLDQINYILKGGEEGKTIVPGKPGESALVERIQLALDAEDHMPPKEKAQLTKEEIALLHWWVETGGSDTTRIGHLQQPAGIKMLMAALDAGTLANAAAVKDDIPTEKIPFGDTAAMNALQQAGVTVLPVEQGSSWLSINFVGAFKKDAATLALLEPLVKQVIWLKLNNFPLDPKTLSVIGRCQSLRKLEVMHCGLKDQDLNAFQSLKSLRSLNLVGNPVTVTGLASLKPINGLQQLYVYQTKLVAADWSRLQTELPAVKIDSGGYSLPMLPGDTSKVKIN